MNMLGAFVEAMSPYPENVQSMNKVADQARQAAREAVEENFDKHELEMDAAQYLAAHVAQVKLEAAEAEYSWSSQVDELRSQNKSLSQEVQKLKRVVKENSLQWRLRERDDWKNLVSTVRKDRDRLDHENAKLKARVASLERQLTLNGVQPVSLMSPETSGRKSRAESGSRSKGRQVDSSGGKSPQSPSDMTERSKSLNSSAHPSEDDVPHATMMRFKELEAQLADSISREDAMRARLRSAERELQLWKVEKQADWLNQIDALQSKLNMELEQKWARNRGHRPLLSPHRTRSAPGIVTRLIEVVAPYPALESDFDELRLLNLAKTAKLSSSASAEEAKQMKE